ncbi:ABC transporter substrate-binding protein [Sphaerisporangium fuscum]|uniref:ABC transporter substrate-binding protein n=1 Tax=Sphaerisporangium fuscum TaxID=2835868 RepID=UPI001BDD7ACB|nr:ABC transporter substrate-binding protein [Sphaerisporangium fuscum]
MQELWYSRRPEPTATGTAADLGWLDDEFGPEGIATRPLRDVREHRPRTLFGEDGNALALWARSRGAPTRLIGLTWTEERQAVLTRPYVTIDEPEDLRGRRLGLPLDPGAPVDIARATALRGFQGALWAGGLTLNDARLVDVPGEAPTALLEALARGEIDAVYVKGEPALRAAERHGLRVAIDLDGHPDRRVRLNDGTLRAITVDQLLLDVRPDVVARFLRVLLDAAEWAGAHPDQALELWRESGGPPVPDGPRRLPDLSIDLSAERLRLLAEQERFLRAHGFLDAAVDVYAWAEHAALGSAQSRRRTPMAQAV